MEDGDFDFTDEDSQDVSTENISLGFSLDMIQTIKIAHAFNAGYGGSVYSNPVISGDAVLFGACDNYFYSVDRNTGELLWKFRANDVTRTALVSGGRIYFGSFDQNVYALDMDGKLIWKFEARDKVNAEPVTFKGLICVGSKDRYMYALDPATGRLAWKFETQGRVSGKAVVHGDILLFGSGDNNLYALNKEGRLLWKFPTQGHVAVPFVHKGVIYFGSMDHSVYAIREEDRSLLWKFNTNLPVSTVTQAVLDGDGLLVGARDYNMYKIGFDGRLIWKFRTSHMIHSNPVLSGNLAFFGSDDDIFYAVDTESGKLAWKLKTNGPVISDPALLDGVLYFGSWDCHLYAVSTRGEVLWKFRTSTGAQSNIEVEMKYVTNPIEFVTNLPEVTRKDGEAEEEGRHGYGEFSTSYAVDMSDYLGSERASAAPAGSLKRYRGGGKYR